MYAAQYATLANTASRKSPKKKSIDRTRLEAGSATTKYVITIALRTAL
jgi:hypothetical protein